MLDSILNFISEIAWPLVVFVIVLMFKSPITKLILRIKSFKYKDWEIKASPAYRAWDKIDNETQLVPLDSVEKPVETIKRLSETEIEQSKQKALKRLEDDTNLAGYERGKLFQRLDGAWAIGWDIKAHTTLGFKT